jgi:hypothetical protein
MENRVKVVIQCVQVGVGQPEDGLEITMENRVKVVILYSVPRFEKASRKMVWK